MQAMKSEPEHLTVIVDSREQHLLKLGMPCKRGTFSPGDYTQGSGGCSLRGASRGSQDP